MEYGVAERHDRSDDTHGVGLRTVASPVSYCFADLTYDQALLRALGSYMDARHGGDTQRWDKRNCLFDIPILSIREEIAGCATRMFSAAEVSLTNGYPLIAAWEYQCGIAASILDECPIPLGDLIDLRVDRDLVRNEVEEIVGLRVLVQRRVGGGHVEHIFSEDLRLKIQRFMRVFRPFLKARSSTALFARQICDNDLASYFPRNLRKLIGGAVWKLDRGAGA